MRSMDEAPNLNCTAAMRPKHVKQINKNTSEWCVVLLYYREHVTSACKPCFPSVQRGRVLLCSPRSQQPAASPLQIQLAAPRGPEFRPRGPRRVRAGSLRRKLRKRRARKSRATVVPRTCPMRSSAASKTAPWKRVSICVNNEALVRYVSRSSVSLQKVHCSCPRTGAAATPRPAAWNLQEPPARPVQRRPEASGSLSGVHRCSPHQDHGAGSDFVYTWCPASAAPRCWSARRISQCAINSTTQRSHARLNQLHQPLPAAAARRHLREKTTPMRTTRRKSRYLEHQSHLPAVERKTRGCVAFTYTLFFSSEPGGAGGTGADPSEDASDVRTAAAGNLCTMWEVQMHGAGSHIFHKLRTPQKQQCSAQPRDLHCSATCTVNLYSRTTGWTGEPASGKQSIMCCSCSQMSLSPVVRSR